MKTNVDLVNLIAIQELADVSLPALTDYLNIGKSTDLLGKRISINALAALISSALGSGSLIPERRYKVAGETPESVPAGASIIVNGDGQGEIDDPFLDGKVYDVHRNGMLIAKGVLWDNTVVGGGIVLLQPGDIFSGDEEVIVTFQPQFSSYIPSPDAIARFTNGEQVITASSTITAGMFRKLIVLQGSSSVLTVGLPAASAYPQNVILAITSNGGLHKQATLACNGTDTLLFNNTIWSNFYIGQNDQILLIPTVAGNGWRVIYWTGSERFNRIGSVDFGYLKGPNQFVATTDTPVLRADYPGVWAWVQRLAIAQPAAVVNNAVWLLNKGLWGTGDGSTTFNFPNLSGRFMRYADPDGVLDQTRFAAGTSNLPGSKEGDMIPNHGHNYTEPKLKANSDSGGAPDAVDVQVGTTTNVTGITADRVGYETRPFNTLGLPLINY